MNHDASAGAQFAGDDGTSPRDSSVLALFGEPSEGRGVYACRRDAGGGIVEFLAVGQEVGARVAPARDSGTGPQTSWPRSVHAQADAELFAVCCDVMVTGRSACGVFARGERGAAEPRHIEVRVARHGDGIALAWRDVTEREHIKESFYRLIDGNPFGLYVVDADFRLARVSKGAQKVFQSIRPLLGRDFAEVLRTIWTEPFASVAIQRFRHTLATGEPYLSPATVELRNDVAIVEAYDWRIERVELPDGRPGVVCYFYDLSERQQYEAALRTGEAKLRLALEASSTGMFEWNAASGRLDWSPETHAIHGLDASAFDGTLEAYARLVHPEDRDRVLDAVRTALAESTAYRSDFRIVRPDGEVRWVAASGRAYRKDGAGPLTMLGTIQDITERRSVEDALARTAERLQLAKRAGRLGIFDYDLRAGTIEWDERMYELWGIESGAPVSFDVFLAGVHPDDRDAVRGSVRAALDARGGGHYAVEYRIVAGPHAVVRWVAAHAAAVFVDGAAVRFVGTVQDITERKTAETRLRDSEAQFRTTANAAPAMLWITEASGHCSFLSARWREYTGQAEAEGCGNGWLDAVHPDDREASRRVFENANARREPFSIDYRLRRADGVYRWVIDEGRPRSDAAGNFAGYVGSVIDMHERRVALDALNESEQRFRALADNMTQFAWIANPDGDKVWFNRRWYEYTGTTLEQVRAWEWRSVQHPDHAARVVDSWRRAVLSGENWEDTFPLRGRDGTFRWFLSRAAPIRDDSGRIVLWFGTNTDITEQRAAEAALLEADRRKDEFLAVLAHELRNPLAPLRNSLQLLKTQTDPALGARLRAIMERQVDTLVRLVDDLLDVSRITHGKLQLDATRIDLRDAMRVAVEACAALIESSGHRLEIEMTAQPVPVRGDLVRLAQVFSNLLNNAARYTPAPGVIRFSLRVEGGMAIAEVADSGVGIAPAMLERVFDMFAQAAGSTNHAQHGLGIGLSLARSLVNLHGGRIEAESEGPGRGSRFSVRLPLLEEPASPSQS